MKPGAAVTTGQPEQLRLNLIQPGVPVISTNQLTRKLSLSYDLGQGTFASGTLTTMGFRHLPMRRPSESSSELCSSLLFSKETRLMTKSAANQAPAMAKAKRCR